MSVPPNDLMDTAMGLRRLIIGYRSSQAVYVAAKLDIAGRIRSGTSQVKQLAHQCGVDECSLERVLKMLCQLDVFIEETNGRYRIGPLGGALLDDAPATQRPLAIMSGEPWHWQTWGELLYSVKTGKPGFDHLFGLGRFEYFSQHAEAAKIFNEAQAGLTKLEYDAVLESYDFSSIKVLVDVGGGSGELLAAILKRYPDMRGIVFDLPHCAEDAHRLLQKEGLQDRCKVMSGSFFNHVPPGGDAYIIKRTLHNWTDERAAEILKRIRENTGPGCKLLVAEKVVTDKTDLQIAGSNLQMLVMDGAADRSEAQFRSLFEAGGFDLTRIYDTECPIKLCIIEGVPKN